MTGQHALHAHCTAWRK